VDAQGTRVLRYDADYPALRDRLEQLDLHEDATADMNLPGPACGSVMYHGENATIGLITPSCSSGLNNRYCYGSPSVSFLGEFSQTANV
jgi:hypothetical protein